LAEITPDGEPFTTLPQWHGN